MPPERYRDEPDLETLLLLPVALPPMGALLLRDVLVRRLGRLWGNLLGVPPVVLLGAFPLVYGCAVVLIVRGLFWAVRLLARAPARPPDRARDPSA